MNHIFLKINLVVSSFLLVSILQAQEGRLVSFYTNENDLFQEESQLHYLLANDVILRSEANKESTALGKLNIGTGFQILKKSEESLTIKNIKSNWYKIKINASTDTKTGWIWGGFIAQYAFGSENDASVKFVAGIEKMEQNEGESWEAYYQVRAFRNNEQIAKLSLKCPAWEFDNVSNIGKKGLKNVDDILTFNIPCSSESCGCTVGESYVFWYNEQFHYVGDALGIADADYSTWETFIFPSDMEGKSDIIIKEISDIHDEIVIDGDEKTTALYREVTQQELEWNGQDLKEKGNIKQVKMYKISYQ